MTFAMAALARSKSGVYTARKAIPKDVQNEYARLYGPRWEVKLALPASLRPQEAKARYGEWLSEVEGRITAIRAGQRGDRQSLSQKQAMALAGEWYRSFIAQHEENPGSPEQWEENFWVLIDQLMEHVSADIHSQNRKYLDQIVRNPEVRGGIRPAMAEEARADQFLADRGISLTPEAYDLFIDCVLEEYVAGVLLLKRRAGGDYRPDRRPEQFPKFEPAQKSHKDPAGLTPWKLFEMWVDAKKPAEATVDRWRGVFVALQKHFEGRTAGSITTEEAQAWAESLVTPKRSAGVVQDIWCNAARTVFKWAVDTKKLSANPFQDVKIAVPRKVRSREKVFRSEEIRLILKASRKFTETEQAFDAARRWVPWICAYTGARAGEITQLRGQDLVKRDGRWAIQITPEAGTLKTHEARTVPLHEHLIDQGFVDFVRNKGDGPLFYNEDTPLRATTTDPTNPRKARSVKTRERIGNWVRTIGVTAKGIQPNHAWRHTFKQIADRAGISEKISDAITGHAPASVARSYGAPTVGDMAEAMKKFPRYEVAPTKGA
jgi:integrase